MFTRSKLGLGLRSEATPSISAYIRAVDLCFDMIPEDWKPVRQGETPDKGFPTKVDVWKYVYDVIGLELC